jgi:cellulose synthase/poly-beta-1,6-N-acetylglucosamine synthase-like glycosyltransferase
MEKRTLKTSVDIKWRRRAGFFASKAVGRIAIAIPARDETERIGDCLASLAAQREALGEGFISGPFCVVVFLNGCNDCSFDIAAQMAPLLPYPLRIFDGDLPPNLNHAGGARHVAMALAADWIEEAGGGSGYILTTDADSRASPTWIADTMAAFRRGVDAVAGRIELDRADEAALSAALRARGVLEEKYETLLTEIFARLDPRPHDPWPRHASEPGASLALTLAAYRRIGGLPIVEFGEDRALVAALENADLKLRHDPTVNVVTSGRLIGRARGGVADALTFRSENPQAECDPYLEPAAQALRRAMWRGRLRGLSERGALTDVSAWSRRLRICSSDASSIARETSFGAFWRFIEAQSPLLQRRSLTPRELPLQIALAQLVLLVLRRAPIKRRVEHRDDIPASAPLEGPPQNSRLPAETR